MTDRRQATNLQCNLKARSRDYCCDVREMLSIMSVYL